LKPKPNRTRRHKNVTKRFRYLQDKKPLRAFIKPIAATADKPRQRFLHQIIKAILLSGSQVINELAFFVHDKCTERFNTLKRQLNHLVSLHGELSAIIEAYHRSIWTLLVLTNRKPGVLTIG